jgi:hypothetical protein
MSIDIAPIEHVAAANAGARAATERAITKWMLVHGTHPDRQNIIMLSVAECATGRPVATGFGLSELTACNALLADLTERCRGLLAIRRMSKVWRDQLRHEAGELRADKTHEFFASRKTSLPNTSSPHPCQEPPTNTVGTNR